MTRQFPRRPEIKLAMPVATNQSGESVSDTVSAAATASIGEATLRKNAVAVNPEQVGFAKRKKRRLALRPLLTPPFCQAFL
jgi:hypothetical protein